MKRWFAQRPFRRAACWLVFLGPLFYATYGFANWWATTRAQVPSMAFATDVLSQHPVGGPDPLPIRKSDAGLDKAVLERLFPLREHSHGFVAVGIGREDLQRLAVGRPRRGDDLCVFEVADIGFQFAVSPAAGSGVVAPHGRVGLCADALMELLAPFKLITRRRGRLRRLMAAEKQRGSRTGEQEAAWVGHTHHWLFSFLPPVRTAFVRAAVSALFKARLRSPSGWSG